MPMQFSDDAFLLSYEHRKASNNGHRKLSQGVQTQQWPPEPLVNTAPASSSRFLVVACFLFLCVLTAVAMFVWMSVSIHIQIHHYRNQQGDTLALQKPYSIDDMFNSSMQPQTYVTHWIGDGSAYYYESENGSVLWRDVGTGEVLYLLNSSILQGRQFTLSNDLRFVLIINSTYQNSKNHHYLLYDRDEERFIAFPNHASLNSNLNGKLQTARFTQSGQGIVFVHANDIYYQKTALDEAVGLTRTGKHHQIYNGITDWTYHHLLDSALALWESPDTSYLAYLRLNTTSLPRHRYNVYSAENQFDQHVTSYPFRHAGGRGERSQTLAELWIANLGDVRQAHKKIQAPLDLHNREHYIVQVTWRDSGSFAVMWTNRAQNHSIVTICDVTGDCQENHKEMIVGGWIEPWPPIYFIHGGESYLTILSKPDLESGDWPNLAIVSSPLGSPGSVRFLTHGQQEVTSIAAFDAKQNSVYYVTSAGNCKQRFIHSVRLYPADPDGPNDPVCLSCDLDPECTYASVTFSPDTRYYNLHCQGPGIPYNVMRATNGSFSEVLESNDYLRAALSRRDLPRVRYLQVPVGEGNTAWAKITVPQESDRDQDRKWYPVLFQVSPFPTVQTVDDRFILGLPTLLASNNIVHVHLDGRGTEGRGDRYRHLIYRQMAKIEVDDQLLAARWMITQLHMTDKLVTNLHIADKKKFAIWGQGYGGLLALHALANESNTFKCAVAAGALTDMRYQGAVAAERYMGYATEQDNLAAYERSSILTKIEKLRGKKLLLGHGTADASIHFTSSASLIKALIKADIPHLQQIYPDKTSDVYSSRHFTNLALDFLLNRCFVVDNSF